MLELNLGFSDILSILALVISILGTFAGIFYTKKQFEAAFYPRLSLQVHQRAGGVSGLKTCLSFKITNQSNDRSANNVRLEAFLSHPIWHWRLWTIKWYKFFEKDGLDIPPEGTKETIPVSHGQLYQGIEIFLLESFPKIVYPENDPSTPEEVAFRKPVTFLLHVRVVYQPPILKAPDVKQDYYFLLTPHFRKINGNPYCLNFWETKSLKKS